MAQRTTIAPESTEKTGEETTTATTIKNNAALDVSTCRHHWVIQPADGPVSNGSCQVCGETREFKNYVESATWGDRRITNIASTTSVEDSTSDDDDVSDNHIESDSDLDDDGEE